MVQHEGYEYGCVGEGELEVTIGDEVFNLRPAALGFSPRARQATAARQPDHQYGCREQDGCIHEE